MRRFLAGSMCSALWVADGYSGQGYGTKIMQAAEKEARRRGVKGVYLDTLEFSGSGLLCEAWVPRVRKAEEFSRRSRPALAGEGAVMSSNIKPKPSAKESPTEPFKRAVTGCLRAIARKPELEVAFAAERPGIVSGKARLPEPPRKLTGADAAIVRGHADSIALKLACHDPTRAPQARARRSAGARGVRGGRAGARRGDRRAPHVRRRQESLRHDRRPLPSRQVRRGHRSRRRADRGGCRHDGARAAHRPGAAAGGARSSSISGGR